jgi:hypothetical protein
VSNNGEFSNVTFLVVITNADLKKPISMHSIGTDGSVMAMLVRPRAVFVVPNQENGLQDMSKIPFEALAKAKSVVELQLMFEENGVVRLDG